MSISGYNISLDQGTDYSLNLTIRDSNLNPKNISGYAFTGIIKYRYSETGSRGNFSCSVTNATGGQVVMSLSNSQSANIPVGRHLYELEVTDAGSLKEKYLKGYIEIAPELNN